MSYHRLARRAEQLEPEQPKRLGGITGRGFLPDQSGNPKGRPQTKGLLVALRNKIAEVSADGRTIETLLVEVSSTKLSAAGTACQQSR